MGHRERISRYRTEGGGANLVRVEVLVPASDRASILGEAARLREAHRARIAARGMSGSASGWSRKEVLSRLAPKYVWWELNGTDEQRAGRILAQIMDLGTYDDILAVESAFDRGALIEVLKQAQPGWFSARSWEFWRGRLSIPDDGEVPKRPPRRSFNARLL